MRTASGNRRGPLAICAIVEERRFQRRGSVNTHSGVNHSRPSDLKDYKNGTLAGRVNCQESKDSPSVLVLHETSARVDRYPGGNDVGATIIQNS
jgi:hypothetical protein